MYTRITVWTLAVLFILTTLATPAWARYRGGQAQIPPAEDEDEELGIELAATEVAVLDDSYLESWEVLTASQYEITMLWTTTSGCEFELRFDPTEEMEVLGGEDEVCDFLEWAESAATYVEADRVISVWDSPIWLSMLEYAAANSSEAESDLGDDPLNPDDYVDVHDASDCQLMWAGTAFAGVACAGTVIWALGATGLTLGGFTPFLLATIGACGGVGVMALLAENACSEDIQDLLDRPEEDLWIYDPHVDPDHLQSLAQPEDLSEVYEVILDDSLDLYEIVDAEAVLATCLDLYADPGRVDGGFYR